MAKFSPPTPMCSPVCVYVCMHVALSIVAISSVHTALLYPHYKNHSILVVGHYEIKQLVSPLIVHHIK